MTEDELNVSEAQELIEVMQSMHALINKDLCQSLMDVVNAALDKGGEQITSAHLVATAAHLVSNLIHGATQHGLNPKDIEDMAETTAVFITTCVAGFQLQDQMEQDDDGE